MTVPTLIENDELPERDDIPTIPENTDPDEILADREIGFHAGLEGEEFRDTQTEGWKIGWADAQE